MTDLDLSPAPTVADCHAVLDAHGIAPGRLGQRVRWLIVDWQRMRDASVWTEEHAAAVVAEVARLQEIEAVALAFAAAIAACDGIGAAEAALLAAIERSSD